MTPFSLTPLKCFVTIVLDGVGIGAQEDAGAYGDAGANTLGHVCKSSRPYLPNLERMGLACITPLEGVACPASPKAHFGKMRQISAGKDSTTGHWELAGVHLDAPFPTFPGGFPPELIKAFLEKTGCDGILGNRADSGTAIIEALGEDHLESGKPIVYTSADSVFQIAAHTAIVSLDRLYQLCQIARDQVCTGPYGVGRVIARPFDGQPGSFTRLSSQRKDFALPPPVRTLQDQLQEAGIRTLSIGKVADLFAGRGFDSIQKTRSNEQGMEVTLAAIADAGKTEQSVFIWTNLVDFDQDYGHRNDPKGFAAALESFDRWIPELLDKLPKEGGLFITADHGNDPTTPGTDHSREFVPVLWYDGREGRPVGIRESFADHAATVATYFGLDSQFMGTSML